MRRNVCMGTWLKWCKLLSGDRHILAGCNDFPGAMAEPRYPRSCEQGSFAEVASGALIKIYTTMATSSPAFDFTDSIAGYLQARFIWVLHGMMGPEPVPCPKFPIEVVMDCELLVQKAADTYRNPSE